MLQGMVPLSVLDVIPIASGQTPSAAIQQSLALARRVDELGYKRFWVAEHHNTAGIASSAPEVLIGHIAGMTKRIRVGAGGIMLPNHAPLRVLEIFRTLESLYPGRIDLGIGRAPGTDQVTSIALRRKSSAGGDVNDQIAELVAFASGGFPEGHPFAQIEAMPTDVAMPPMWMLGSTSAGAAIAAELGVGFAFAGHFSMAEAAGAVETYRSRFEPSASVPTPQLIMAVTAVCGETDKEAEELAMPLRVAFARIATGARKPIPTIAEARDHRFSPQELAGLERFTKGMIVGSPARVAEGLEKLARETHATEIMISSILPEQRIESYERIAKAVGM